MARRSFRGITRHSAGRGFADAKRSLSAKNPGHFSKPAHLASYISKKLNELSEIQIDTDFLFVVPTPADYSSITAKFLGGDPGRKYIGPRRC